MGAALLALFQLHNDDAFFHIATGRWILAHGQVPLHNPFTYAGDGATWLQHQWLSAVAIAWIADSFGIVALVWLKAVWVGAVFAVLAWHLDRSRLPVGVGASMLAIAAVAAAFRFYERPLLVSALALAVVATALLRWQQQDLRGRLLPAVAALTTVLAWHLHAGALHSLLAWAALVGGLGLSAGLARRGEASHIAAATGALRRAGLWFAVTLLLTALTLALFAPSGLWVMALPARFSINAYWHAHLAEFRPLAWTSAYTLQWLAVALAAIVAIWAASQRRWAALLLVVGFTALALRHQRMVWTMTIATVAAVGALELSPDLHRRLRGVAWHAGLLLLSLVLLLAGWMDQDAWFRMGVVDDGVDHRRHPVALLQRAADLPGETFVSDGLAGTWLWLNYRDKDANGRPIEPNAQHRVLVHNCMECYKESTYIDVYQAIRYGAPGWRQQVERLGIRSFVLKYTTPGERRFQGGKPNVRQQLFADPDWLLVDFDDAAAVYVQRDDLPAGMATLEPFPVDPDTGRARSGWSREDVLVALLAHAAARPRVARGLDMARRRVGRVDPRPTSRPPPDDGCSGTECIVWEYWRRWNNNRYGWPQGADATSPYAAGLKAFAEYLKHPVGDATSIERLEP